MAIGRNTVGAVLAGTIALNVAVAACGARTELELPFAGERAEGGGDAGSDVPVDAPTDTPMDVPEDVPPLPPECSGPEVTYIYVVTSSDELLAFKPQSDTFELIGTLDCPTFQSPFSMAVSQDAVAHVLYQDGELFEVDILDASCEPTGYVPPFEDEPFFRFGMGYGADPSVPQGESLFVADITFSEPSLGLARLDIESFELSYIGPFSENPGNAIELTPTGNEGALYGYFLNQPPPGGTLVQIDIETADIVESTLLEAGDGASSLALAWWGGAFYIFTGAAGEPTRVTRYDPQTQVSEVVATLGPHVVGAGVSTCAPDRL